VRYSIDLKPYPGLIFIEINNRIIDSSQSFDDGVTVSQCHPHGCIVVCKYPDHALGIRSCLDDLNVGRGLLGETCSVDL
jgi:hypothetical protein